MYGINLKHMYPFVAASIATGLGLELAVISGVSATNSGNGAWLGILNVQVESKLKVLILELELVIHDLWYQCY